MYMYYMGNCHNVCIRLSAVGSAFMAARVIKLNTPLGKLNISDLQVRSPFSISTNLRKSPWKTNGAIFDLQYSLCSSQSVPLILVFVFCLFTSLDCST